MMQEPNKKKYRVSGSNEWTTLKITTIIAPCYNFSCPLINTGWITLWFKDISESRCIGPWGRSGESIKKL